MITSRERVLTALNHEEPDRVPIQVDFTPEAAEKLTQRLAIDNVITQSDKSKPDFLALTMEHDLLVACHGIETGYYQSEQEEYTDEWGIRWKWVDIPGGRYTEMIEHPLDDMDSFSTFKLPDPSASWRYVTVQELVQRHGSTHAIAGSMTCTLLEAAWYLRGFENFLMDLVMNKDFVHALLDKLYEFQVIMGKRLAETGVDILWIGDDFGTQESLLVSRETWREFFQPRFARFISEVKAVKPDLKIAFHSDGNIESLLPDMIEIGVDIFNAVQPLAIDPAHLKRRFGSNLSYWGTVDIQEVLPFGTAEDVRNEVKQRIQTVAPGGGFILAPSHSIQPDVPLENMLAFYNAAREFGNYPV